MGKGFRIVNILEIFVFINIVFWIFMVMDIIKGSLDFFLVNIVLKVFNVVLICRIFW